MEVLFFLSGVALGALCAHNHHMKSLLRREAPSVDYLKYVKQEEN